MLIEQKHVAQFKQLNLWVMRSLGTAPELLLIESYAEGKSKAIDDYQDWKADDLLKLMAADPKFSEVDIKELFWVSRDNIVEQMSGLSLVSTRVRSIFNKAYNASSDTVRENVCANDIAEMPESDIEELFDLVDSKILTDPTARDGFVVYYFCVRHGIGRAYNRLLEVLGRVDTTKIPFSLGNKFRDILCQYSQDRKLTVLLEKNTKLMRSITGNDQRQ